MLRYRLLLALWLLSDLALFLKSYALAYFLRVGFIFSSDFPFDRFLITAAIVAPLWLGVLLTTRCFALLRNQATLRSGAYIAYASFVAVALFTLAYYFRYEAFFSRLLLVEAFAINAGATWLWHILFAIFLRHMLRRDPPSFPTLIVGVTRESQALIRRLNRSKSPLTPVAVLDGQGVQQKEIDGVPVLGKLNLLESALTEQKITHLIQCSDLEQSLNLLSACRNRGITYMLLPSVLGIVERDEVVESLEGQPMTIVRPQRSRWGWFVQ
jgi:FlaA1/EpsC-like NDP-sugar epimerase